MLRQRLPLTVDIARIRERVVYGGAELNVPAFDESIPSVAAVTKALDVLGWTSTRPRGYSEETENAVVRSYVEFVELCERKEAETGEPVSILASY